MRTLTDSPVFCAICGCSLESGHLTGSSAPHALRERRQFVRHKRVAVERGEPDSCAGERYVVDGEEWDTSTEWPNDYEPEGYNPTLVSRESLEWLAESCCLAINEGAEAGSRGFISGQTLDYWGAVVEVTPGNDPNEPRDEEDKGPYTWNMVCYDKGEADMDCFVAFPFHNCCLDILSDVFAGSGDSRLEGIDKDVLYHVMSCLASELRDGLLLSTVSCFHPILDYGFVSGRDAGKGRWRPLSGEEFSVSNPSATAAVTDELRQSLVGDPVFKLRPETSVLVRNPVLQDPFSRLPNELLMTIARLLSGHDLLALLKASWPALAATRSNGFWKWHLTHEMPWLNSLRPLLDGQEPEEKVTLDYKKLYLWLDKVTAPKYGVDGPFLSLANRRRIWGVCEQLAALYFGHRDVHAATPSDVQ